MQASTLFHNQMHFHAGLTGSKPNTRQYVIVIGCQAYRVESRSVSSDRCRYPVLARMNGLDKHKS